ncbi:DUF6232 family protein [Streptomyces aurantiogriseus]|nr:DUF6232 family protein [Streptomyces aurantiogriseus]
MPTPPRRAVGVDLKVSKRLLWVGEAAYPLHNVTRVHTLVLRPKRMEALTDFLKWTALTVVASVVIQVVADDDSVQVMLLLLGGALVVWLFVRMLKLWSAPDEHVLAVETNSASTALVTLPNPEQLRQLVQYIVNAIENPEAEFQVRVESLQINPKNYQYGDTVNMYGGLANTGVVKK